MDARIVTSPEKNESCEPANYRQENLQQVLCRPIDEDSGAALQI
jgi:hypothetical protein